MKTKIAILIIGITALSLGISCNSSSKDAKPAKVPVIEKKQAVKATAQVKTNLVCFVNNKFMGIDQIPVEVDGKTYYGCCEDCVGKLNNIRATRYATDPLTGAEVDKALAYIVKAPSGNNDVLYFASEENYLKYTK